MSPDNRATAINYGSEEAAMQEYLRQGEKRAYALGNRGPIRFTEDGKIHSDILEAYWRTGFYVFENVAKPVILTAAAATHSQIDQASRPRH